MLKIEHGTRHRYALTEGNETIFSAEGLYEVSAVMRYLNGVQMDEVEYTAAVAAICSYDDECERIHQEYEEKRQAQKEKAAARKAAQEEVGKRLKELRKETPLQEVAAAVHITENSLSDYETGKRMPRDEVKIALADYYGINVATLFNVSFED